MVVARVTSKGQITIPKEVRDRLCIEPGDSVEFRFEGERIEVIPVRRRRLSEFRGVFRVGSVLKIQEERARARAARADRLTADETSDGE